MIKTPSTTLAAMVAANSQPASNPDTLLRLRGLVMQAHDLESQKAELEQRLKATNIELFKMYHGALPDLFDEVGVSEIKLPPSGNFPAISAEIKPFYHANIAADWPPEQRDAAFKYLTTHGSQDLIKTELTIIFNREDRAQAVNLYNQLAKRGLTVNIRAAVPWATLTAWLKEQIEKHSFMPDLVKIGGQVGRVVKLKQPKE